MANTARMESQSAMDDSVSSINTETAPVTDSTSSRPILPKNDNNIMVESARTMSDNDETLDLSTILEEDAQEVIGVSMGHAQTFMKSPTIPAAKKVAVMDDMDDYFDGKSGEDTDDEGKDTEHSLDSVTPESSFGDAEPQDRQDAVPIVRDSQIPFTEATELKPPQRSDMSRSALREGDGRQRSSSGPMSMPDFVNLRRFLPNLPSIPLPKSPSFPSFPFGDKQRDENGEDAAIRKRSSTMFSRSALQIANSIRSVSPRRRFTAHFGPQATQVKDSAGPDSTDAHPRTVSPADEAAWTDLGSVDSTRPRSLRRATSDNSLFLKRSISKSSTLDDFSRWDNVQDQINSRFKAITDSLQDSSMVPKFLRPDLTQSRPDNDLGHRANAFNARVGTQILTERQRAYAASPVQGAMTAKAKTSHPILKDSLSRLTGDVVLLGGYRGSILRSATPPHRQLWVPVKVGLNLRKVDLEVGLEPEDEEKMEETIIADGMLSHIGPVDISRRLLKKLRKCENHRTGKMRVHDYGYDWRLSPHLLTQRLTHFLESLECNASGTPMEKKGAMVIAHSLGGLITRHVVNQRPDLFAGVLYAGVPQHCVNILGPLRNGDDVLVSSRVLTAQVNFTLRTSFALLPDDGRCFIDRETKEEYPVNFFDADAWDEYRLSPCIAPPFRASIQDNRKSIIDAMSSNLPSLPVPGKKSAAVIPDAPRGHSKPSPTSAVKDSAKSSANNAQREVVGLAHQAAHPDQTLAPHLSPPPSPSPTGYNQMESRSISTACTIPHDRAVAYLERTLAETLKFRSELVFNPALHDSNAYPPASVLYTKSIPTVYGARVSSRDAIKCVEAYDDLAFAAGDGVCLARAAMLPKGYMVVKGGLVKSERGHVGLLGDLEGVGQCLRALMEARDRGCGLGWKKEDLSPKDPKSPVWDGLKNAVFGQK